MRKSKIKFLVIFILCPLLILAPFHRTINQALAEDVNPFVFVDPGLVDPPQGTLTIETLTLKCNAYDSGWLELRADSNYSTDDGSGPIVHDETDSLWLNFSGANFDQIQVDWNEQQIEEFLESSGFFHDELPNNVGELGFLIHSETIDPLELALEAETLGADGIGYVGDNVNQWFEDCLAIYAGPSSLPAIMGNGFGMSSYENFSHDMQMVTGSVWQKIKNIIKSKAFKKAVGVFQGLGLVVAIIQGDWARAAYEAIELILSLNPLTGPIFGPALLILDILELIATLLGFDVWCDFVAAYVIPISWTSCEPDDDPPPSGGGPTGLNYGDNFLFTDDPYDIENIENLL